MGSRVHYELEKFLIEKNYVVFGIDNDMRSYFFGKDASTKHNESLLKKQFKSNYHPNKIDVRSHKKILDLFDTVSNNYDLNLVIHTAAQPSHDWATKEPITDFTINANGTLNMLEATKLKCPKATFIFTSTNKVYGDTPNKLPGAKTHKL
jgi:CDP-paratose 2-epimerase